MSNQLADFFNSIHSKEPEIKVFSKKKLSSSTEEKLLGYQIEPTIRMVDIATNKKIVINGSDTGTGKTYMVAAACKELERRPLIICPKSVMYTWVSVCEYMDIEAFDIVNFETIKNGKTYKMGTDDKGNPKYTFRNRKDAEYLETEVDENGKRTYIWLLPKDVIVVVDEAHRSKNVSSENGRFLKSLRRVMERGRPVVLISATLCEKIKDMKLIMYLLGKIDDTPEYNKYMDALDEKYPELKVRKRDYKREPKKYQNAKEDADAKKIHMEIKDFSCRVKIKDLGDRFPSNQWYAQLFIAEETDKIVEAYDELAEHMRQLKENNDTSVLGKIVKLKQEIELRKIPIFVEEAKQLLEEGNSVIIFVNYLETLRTIADELNIVCRVYGGNEEYGKQTLEEREEAIRLFQSNERRIIICQIKSGSVGISLHDLHGDYPRRTLINLPDTASDIIQAMGRAPRAGAKSAVIQKIVLVANVPFEEKAKRNIDRRMKNVSTINDNDIDLYKYRVVKKRN